MHKKATPRPFRLILLRAKLAATEALCDVLTLRHVTRTKVSSRSPCAAAKLHDILQKKNDSTFGGKAKQVASLPKKKALYFSYVFQISN